MASLDHDNLTPEQQYTVFGCGCRCLIRLAAIHGKIVTWEDLEKRFSHLFPPKRFGLTNTAEQIEIAKGLGLCDSANSFRDLREIKLIIKEKTHRGILVLTDRDKDNNPLFHCRLLLKCNEDNAFLYSPCQSGKDYDLPQSWVDLEKEMVHFLVFV